MSTLPFPHIPREEIEHQAARSGARTVLGDERLDELTAATGMSRDELLDWAALAPASWRTPDRP